MSLRTLRRRWTWMLLAALASCGYGYGYVEIGYVPCDPYYYDPYCYDYEYYAWVPAALTATDVDGDGRLDAVVADATDGAVWLARGKDGGGFGDTPSTPFTFPTTRAGVAALNADGDAHPDLLVLDGRPGRIATWAGDGHGGFVTYGITTLAAPDAPGVVRFARGRLDGDAIDDVVTLDEAGTVHVALGTGTGAFVEVAGGDPAAGFLGADAVARLGGVFVTLAELDGRPGTDLGILDGDRARLAVFGGRGRRDVRRRAGRGDAAARRGARRRGRDPRPRPARGPGGARREPRRHQRAEHARRGPTRRRQRPPRPSGRGHRARARPRRPRRRRAHRPLARRPRAARDPHAARAAPRREVASAARGPAVGGTWSPSAAGADRRVRRAPVSPREGPGTVVGDGGTFRRGRSAGLEDGPDPGHA